VHSLYHAVLHIVLLPVLGMLILYGLLSRQIFGRVCFCYPILCAVFLWRSTSCLAPGLVLPLFDFQFLLLSLISSLISCLSIFLMYCLYITLFFHFFFKTSPNFSFVCCISFCFTSFFPMS